MKNEDFEPNIFAKLLTVSQLSERQPAWSVPALRNLIFKAKGNGLEEMGAIVRVGRRVLISERLFIDWLIAQSNAYSDRGTK